MKLLGIQGTGEDGMSLRFDCSYVHIEKNWKLTYPAGGCDLVLSPVSYAFSNRGINVWNQN
jgi:hypothetical protein